MDAKVDRDGTIIVLSLEGAIDVASAPQLKAQFDQLLAHAAPKLLVDLKGVPYIDSYGLGIIMQAVKVARRSGGDMRLCAPCQDVRTVLDITGFSKHGQGFVVSLNIFFGGNRAQLVDDLIEFDGVKAEVLAA